MAERKEIRHRVERTRNKHSRAVFQNETIVIRLASGLSKAEEQKHREDLLRRMTKIILEDNQKEVIDPFRPLLYGARSHTVTLASGKKYRFTLRPALKTKAQPHTRGWTIEIGPRLRRKGLHRLLWQLVSEAERPRVARIAEDINDRTFRKPIQNFRLRIATSQWGSCSPKGIITINAALLFMPPSILKYVIVHELAHLVRADHSPRYWAEVSWAMPSYEKALRKMKEYRLPTL